MKKIYISEDVIENLNLELEPNEIDMSSFKKQKTLNKDIWKNDEELNPRVRLQLLDISDDFIDFLGLRWVKEKDIVLTGSICNYNWSSYSDIDVHIIIDFSEIHANKELVREYVDAKKNEWNNEHILLEIYGFNVEFYVEDVNENAVSNGVYSLEKNEWLSKPDINNVEDISSRKDEKIRKIAANLITKIEEIEEETERTRDIQKLRELMNRANKITSMIKEIRKNGLQKNGEISIGNIVYKVLRRTNNLDRIWKLKTALYDKINSLR